MIFDASSLINMHNGGVLQRYPEASGTVVAFGPQVHRECRSIAQVIEDMIRIGHATLLDDDNVPSSSFVRLMRTYALGPGETECLALSLHSGETVCCDDRLARQMIAAEIGLARVTGTLGVLADLAKNGVISSGEAHAAHAAMIAKGAFLPALGAVSFTGPC